MSMSDEERLDRYIDAFNRGDYVMLRDFYCDDIQLVIGNGKELSGKQAIIDFYSVVRKQTQRTIRILQSFSNGKTIAAELESEFVALEDAPDFTSGPMAKGDRLYINSFALYDLRDGRFARIRAAVFRRIWRRVGDPKSVDR